MESQHHIDWMMELVYPWVNFIIFLGLAFFFMRKPVLAAVKKRREDFDRLVKEAQRARDEAVQKLAVIQQREAGLAAEIAQMKSMSKASAEAEAAKIVSDARTLAKHLKDEAERIANAEIERAKAGLRKEITEAVRAEVVSKLASELDQGRQADLIKRRITELQTVRLGG